MKATFDANLISRDFHIDIPSFNARHNIEFWRYFCDQRDALKEMVANGLVELSDSSLRVAETGRFLVRNICMVLTPTCLELQVFPRLFDGKTEFTCQNNRQISAHRLQ